MKRQIMHMVKYKYVPFTFGKQRYGKKKPSTDEAGASRPWGSKQIEHFMMGNQFVVGYKFAGMALFFIE